MNLKRSWLIAAGLMVSTPCLAAETITYQYDAKGRLIRVFRTSTINNGVQTDYNHDKADNRTQAKTTGSTNPPP